MLKIDQNRTIWEKKLKVREGYEPGPGLCLRFHPKWGNFVTIVHLSQKYEEKMYNILCKGAIFGPSTNALRAFFKC